MEAFGDSGMPIVTYQGNNYLLFQTREGQASLIDCNQEVVAPASQVFPLGHGFQRGCIVARQPAALRYVVHDVQTEGDDAGVSLVLDTNNRGQQHIERVQPRLLRRCVAPPWGERTLFLRVQGDHYCLWEPAKEKMIKVPLVWRVLDGDVASYYVNVPKWDSSAWKRKVVTAVLDPRHIPRSPQLLRPGYEFDFEQNREVFVRKRKTPAPQIRRVLQPVHSSVAKPTEKLPDATIQLCGDVFMTLKPNGWFSLSSEPCKSWRRTELADELMTLFRMTVGNRTFTARSIDATRGMAPVVYLIGSYKEDEEVRVLLRDVTIAPRAHCPSPSRVIPSSRNAEMVYGDLRINRPPPAGRGWWTVESMSRREISKKCRLPDVAPYVNKFFCTNDGQVVSSFRDDGRRGLVIVMASGQSAATAVFHLRTPPAAERHKRRRSEYWNLAPFNQAAKRRALPGQWYKIKWVDGDWYLSLIHI